MVSALFGIIAVCIVFVIIFARVDGVALFAPKSTRKITASARGFCSGRCRTADGRCPLTGSAEPAEDCPLWKFVEADVPTSVYGSPFEEVQAPPASV